MKTLLISLLAEGVKTLIESIRERRKKRRARRKAKTLARIKAKKKAEAEAERRALNEEARRMLAAQPPRKPRDIPDNPYEED